MIYHVRLAPLRAMRSWSIGTSNKTRNEEKIVQRPLAQFRECLLGKGLDAFKIQKIQGQDRDAVL